MQEARGGAHGIRIGCSGWNYASWKDEFYEGKPARLWLQHYARHFDTVEVNNTFYRLPLKSSVAAWVEQTPPDFLFAVKASRYLTHVKRLTDMREGVRRYYERIEPLVNSSKFGSVLWQLPPAFKRNDDRLHSALQQLPPGRHCFEFRHPSWFVEPVYDLLRVHGAALVIGDRPEVKPFQAQVFTAPWTSCGSTTARGDGAVTTPWWSWRNGRAASRTGLPRSRCSPISTMIGKCSPSGMPCG